MGTLFCGPEWSTKHCDAIENALSRFGWDRNTTPEQLQAAIAYAREEREAYLVDRHDEICAGFGEILQSLVDAIAMRREE